MATVNPNPNGWRADVRTLVVGVKVQEAELPEGEAQEAVRLAAVHVSCPFFCPTPEHISFRSIVGESRE